MNIRYLFLIIVSLLICSFAGCSDGDSGQQLSGSITLDGTPVASGWITFSPIKQLGKNAASKITDGDFACAIEPGEYRVEIRSPVVDKSVPLYGKDGPTREVSKESLPSRYNDKSTLRVTIESGSSVEDFELSSSK